MAHIQVVRRSMRPEEYTKLRFGWLKRYIYREKTEITGFEIREAHQTAEMEFDFYDADYRPLRRGDMYFTPDGSAFLRCSTVVPEKYRTGEVYLYLKTAAEMIVKVNGQYAGGIDPNRERMLLTSYIPEDGTIDIDILGYNRSKPDDERNPATSAGRGCRQVFDGAYYAVVRQPVQDLVYDIEILLNIAGSGAFNEDYRALIERELDRALTLIDFDDVRDEDVLAAREYIEQHIFRNDDYRGSGNVALLAHSHLDIAYYWRRIHAVQKNLRTVLIQMRLMDRYPDFKYAHTQAYTYETVEKYYPEVFAELKEKIAAGQFEPVGAMYVEPDCNVPSAESLARQCLYGQLYYREKFGITVSNCWLPDVFGNSWILPQILKKSGVDYFVSNKMSTWNDTNRFPHNNFIWRGIDGSDVYACVPPTHFISWNMPSQIQENWDAYQDKGKGGQTLSMFGYGDGGSGVTEEMIEMMHRFERISVMPKTENLRADEFLEKNLRDNPNLAVWDGELYLEMHRGTFTTKSDLKRGNRKLEFLFREAEMICALRALAGKAYPAEEIRSLYKKFLINQFHDILPGSHIAPVFRDAMADYREIEAALTAIIAPAGERYFNSLNFKRENLTFIPDERGASVREGVRGFWAKPELAPLSTGGIPLPAGDAGWFTAGREVETPYYIIRFADDGSITSLWDKKLDRQWVKGDFNKLKLYADNPGNYDAWDILPNYRDKQYPLTIAEPLHLIAADGESASFACTLTTEQSTWRRVIRVFRASPMIEVENDVDWHELHRLAKAEFDCELLSRELVCDTSAGFIRRETHRNTTWQQARFECCCHKWCDMSESGGGIALLNQGKYGVGGEGSVMSLSLLRATERPDTTSDLGHHTFSYVILPHAGDAVTAGINRAALEYNVPLTRVAEDLSFAHTFDGLYLQAMKLSEDGRSLILRLSEQDGKRGRIRLGRTVRMMNLLEDVTGETDTVEYRPFEILTLALPL